MKRIGSFAAGALGAVVATGCVDTPGPVADRPELAALRAHVAAHPFGTRP